MDPGSASAQPSLHGPPASTSGTPVVAGQEGTRSRYGAGDENCITFAHTKLEFAEEREERDAKIVSKTSAR